MDERASPAAAKDGNGAALPKPRCQLVGRDGNVFSIISNVKVALRSAGQDDRARELAAKAFRSKSYDEVLALCWEYVEVF